MVAASVASFMATSKQQQGGAEMEGLLQALGGFDKGRASSLDVIKRVSQQKTTASTHAYLRR